MPARWLIYALGGGVGHFQRGLSLARAAGDRGRQCTLVTNSPLAHRRELARGRGAGPPLLAMPWLANIEIQLEPLTRDPADAARIADQWLWRPWEAVIVDTFPRGLGGELAERLPRVAAPKALVHRLISERYLRQFGLGEWAAAHYDMLLAPGEAGPLEGRCRRTPPWLLLRPEELLSRAASRRRLGAASDGRPLIVVAASGRPAEMAAFAELAAQLRRRLDRRADVRLASLADSQPSTDRVANADASTGADVNTSSGANANTSSGATTDADMETNMATDMNAPPRTLWPLLALLRGVDLLVGAGGYNTAWEARAAGVPLLGIPQPRMYDLQRRRLRDAERTTWTEASDQVAAWLDARRSTPSDAAPPAFPDGAAAAVDWILDRLARP